MRRLSPTLIYIVLLVIVGIAAYANSLDNQALFHHTPDPYRDSVLDNSMLNSRPLLGKVLTGHHFKIVSRTSKAPCPID